MKTETFKRKTRNLAKTQKTEPFLNSPRKCVVLTAAWIISLLILGGARLTSIMFVACIQRYKTGRRDASFPFVLSFIVRNTAGPFIGFLGKRYGPEAVTIGGCLLSSIGIGGCFFAEDIATITLLWGVVFGLGLGAGSTLVSQILNEYFGQHIDKANGIFYGGSCIGAFALSSIVEASLKRFGTSGTFLILSGLLLHSVPAAMLLRKPKRQAINNIGRSISVSQHSLSHSSVYSTSSELGTQAEGMHVSSSSSAEAKEMDEVTRKHRNVEKQENNEHFSRECSQKDTAAKPPAPLEMFSRTQLDEKQELRGQLSDDASSKFLSKENRLDYSHDSFSKQKKKTSQVILYFQVFVDPTFILILVTQSSSVLSLTFIWTIIVDFSRDIGVLEHQEIYIIIGISISDLVGRFTLGGITDGGCINKINFFALCFGTIGVVLVAFVWLKGFAMLMAGVCALGLFFGGQIMVQPGIVLGFIEQENISMALASRYFLFAPISFAVTPLIEYFRSTLGSYNGLFYLLAGINFLNCILTLLIPYAARYRSNSKVTIEESEH